jgi:hypothetical protein
MAAVNRTGRDGASGRWRRVTRVGRANLTTATESNDSGPEPIDQPGDELTPPDDEYPTPVYAQWRFGYSPGGCDQAS